ncbi:BatD family protein [Fodinibius sediminis]|uniref:Oxygen tolerance n=1 Tax=Fodinibius sediminis TaxID=1214077 RepID=A0A521ABQ8_9BACT|nr:BatD family protein [Fodinibius sediminis]SMO32259.1 Oxygen tolerance [Fodinibius sediminis]
MKRIGNFSCLITSVLSLLVIFSPQALAQTDVSVQATVSETTIYTGERIQLSIQISGSFNEVSRPSLPSFPDGFRLLSNTPSTSRSYRYINGQSSTSYSYNYQLIAQQKGEYQIPAVSVTIDGEQYATEPIQVSVVDRNESARSAGNQQPDIFLQLEVSDSQPVVGQQIISDVVLYFQDGLEVNSYQPVPGWKAEGFWKEELNNAERPEATSTIINGVRYRRARLLQFALFPTKEGSLEISPYKIIVSVRSAGRSRNDPFSSFFGNLSGNQRQVELQTDPLTLDVQSLPASENNSYFGAVGSFQISREISTKQASEGASIEITTRIRGTGNVPLISKPQYELPEGLEVYEPKETSNLNRNNERINGTKLFTDVVVARSPGDYTIPEQKVSYYDPDKGSYVSQALPALSFKVTPSPNQVASPAGNDAMPVRPVTGLASWTTPASVSLLSYWWFWAGLLVPLCLLVLAYRQKTYYNRMSNDRAFARSRKASETASERLDRAIALSEEGEIKQAYNLLQKAITGFIGDRLNLPEAGLSNEEYIKALDNENIDAELVKNIRMLLDKCASISYAPETTHEYLKSHVGLAESTLEKLKKVL